MKRFGYAISSLLVAVLVAVGSGPSAGAASGGKPLALSNVRMYLKVDGIPGESVDMRHPNEIEIGSFSFKTSYPSGLIGTSGKAIFGEVAFDHMYDKSSPYIFQAVASGQLIPKVVLSVTQYSSSADALKYTFENVQFANVEVLGGNEDVTEGVTFRYAKITVQYLQQKQDGTYFPAIKLGWDVVMNRKI